MTPRDDRKLELLYKMQQPCYDDNKTFTNTAKLDKIRELSEGNSYSAIRVQGDLFHLYSQSPLDRLDPAHTIVLSTHADFVPAIQNPFVEVKGDVLHGTFDNSATNAAALYLMLEANLPMNVLVAFTGNEEHGMRGAAELDKFLVSQLGTHPFYLTLDVTNIGYKKKQYSIENTFSLPEENIQDLIQICKGTGYNGYLYPQALADESYEYSRLGAKCCSFCVPTKGPMHSDKGCSMELTAYLAYVDVLERITKWFRPPMPVTETGLGR